MDTIASRGPAVVRAAQILEFDESRRARREVERLVDQARQAIDDYETGDVTALYEADRAVGRATVLVLEHRLDLPQELRR